MPTSKEVHDELRKRGWFGCKVHMPPRLVASNPNYVGLVWNARGKVPNGKPVELFIASADGNWRGMFARAEHDAKAIGFDLRTCRYKNAANMISGEGVTT